MEKKPLLVMTFDDFYPSDFEFVFKEFRSRGILGTSFVNPSPEPAFSWQRSNQRDTPFWDAIKIMMAAGWGIECHTYDHPNLTNLTEEEIREQMIKVNEEFIGQGLSAPRHHAIPYGAGGQNDNIRNIISEYRETVRGTAGNTRFHEWETLDFNHVKSFGADFNNESMVEDLKDNVREAISGKKIMTTFSHSQTATGEISWHGKKGLFTSFLNWVIKQPIEIVTYDDMYHRVKDYQNQM